MNILIIEDEYPAAERLKSQLGRIDMDIQIMGILESVSSARAWLADQKAPDLILSDIQLSDGISFEIFEQTQIESPIIFTTAYDEYAIKAFKLNSIDYLVKPIRQNELERALKKYNKMHRIYAAQQQQEHLLKILDTLGVAQKEYKKRFLVQGKDEWIPVFTAEIAYFTSVHEITYLVRKDGKRYPVDLTLSDLETMLDPLQFYRVNRQFIAHVTAIHRVYPYFNGRLLVALLPAAKDDVIVSKSKASMFKQWFSQEA